MSTIAPLRARRAYEQASWPTRAVGCVRLLAGVALVLAVLVVLGWLLHLEPLLRIDQRASSVKLTSAVAVAALAGGQLVSDRRLRPALLGLAALLGGVALLEHTTGLGLGTDQLVVRDWTTPAGLHPGRPAMTTAVCLVLLAASGLLGDLGRRTLAQLFAAVPLMTALISVYGYLYGVDDVYTSGHEAAMSMYGAILLIVLSCGYWLAVPFGIAQWIAFGRDTGAALQRMLVPVAVAVLPFVGWLEDVGSRAGWYSAASGDALLMAFMALVVGVVGFRVGRTGLSMDQERDTLLDELHRVNATLEDRVRVRSQQLDRQRSKLSLFEERDRIARDLHDRVIQRIFAAGLQVAGLGRTARKDALRRGEDAGVADSLDVIATELDLAIRELRKSIFELTSVDDHDDLGQVVQDIAGRASRILGFMPRVDVTAPADDLAPDLVAQVASVIQEGLSNIARHAYASGAEVAVTVGDAEVALRITDDGVGLPDPLPRSSGINNMLNRARALGGAASWTANEPTGTVLEWRVPKVAAAAKPVGLIDGRGYASAKLTPVASSDSDQSRAASTGS
ncbi:MAG: hypothetical protein QOK15_128 [Nocardioidaceae bacterium]|jgi:signal transduction histidine kinase|nr:hypothetical protein [Nocardioidaceae bacterium]